MQIEVDAIPVVPVLTVVPVPPRVAIALDWNGVLLTSLTETAVARGGHGAAIGVVVGTYDHRGMQDEWADVVV